MMSTKPPGRSAPLADQDMMSMAAALWARRFWIFAPTICAFFASLVVVNLLPTRYAGEARVLLENREPLSARPGVEPRTEAALDAEAVGSQVEIVTSKDLALKVIRDMELTRKAEFDPLAHGLGLVSSIGVMAGLMNDPRMTPLEERVLDVFQQRLLVFPQGRSRVIVIQFRAGDPQLAASIANRIAEEYLASEELIKRKTSRLTTDWLDKIVEPLMRKVMAADAAVEAFRARKSLFVGSNNLTISSQQLADLNAQLATARAQQADLSARAKLIREAVRLGRVFETSEINNNELVRRLLEQRAALKAQIAFDERTLLPGHPRMQELNSQLRDLESQVRAAAERAARALENDSRAAGARLESLQAQLDAQKKTAALSNEDEVQLKALEREASALREQLIAYRNKLLDAAARSGETASPVDGRIISRALAQNDPAFPKRLPIVTLATIGTLVVSAALVASLHLMARGSQAAIYGHAGGAPYPMPLPVPITVAERQPDDPTPPEPPLSPPPGRKDRRPGLVGDVMARLRPDADAPSPQARATGTAEAPAPGVEPVPMPGAMAAGSEPAPAVNSPDSVAAELARLGRLDRAKRMVLQGLGRDARIAAEALRLGRRLAETGPTIIVDLAGSSPLYARSAGKGASALVDYLAGTASAPEIIHRDSDSRLHIVPAGEWLAWHLAVPLAREAVQSLLFALAEAYAYVLVDAGPVGGAGEFAVPMVDCLGLVPAADIRTADLETALARLASLSPAPVLLIGDQRGGSLEAA